MFDKCAKIIQFEEEEERILNILSWDQWIFINKMLLEFFSHSYMQLSPVQLFTTPWTAAHQAHSPGESQAKILEWVVMPSSRGSSQPRD